MRVKAREVVDKKIGGNAAMLREIAEGLLSWSEAEPKVARLENSEMSIHLELIGGGTPRIKETYSVIGPWSDHDWSRLNEVTLEMLIGRSVLPDEESRQRFVSLARRRVMGMTTAESVVTSAIAALTGDDERFGECVLPEEFTRWASLGVLARARGVERLSMDDYWDLTAAYQVSLEAFFAAPRQSYLWEGHDRVPERLSGMVGHTAALAGMVALGAAPTTKKPRRGPAADENPTMTSIALSQEEILREIADGLLHLGVERQRASLGTDEVLVLVELIGGEEPQIQETYQVVGPWPEGQWTSIQRLQLHWATAGSAAGDLAAQRQSIAEARQRVVAMSTAAGVEQAAIAAIGGKEPLFAECQSPRDFRQWAALGAFARARRVGRPSFDDYCELYEAYQHAADDFFGVPRESTEWFSDGGVPANVYFVIEQGLSTALLVALGLKPDAQVTPW